MKTGAFWSFWNVRPGERLRASDKCECGHRRDEHCGCGCTCFVGTISRGGQIPCECSGFQRLVLQ